MARIEQAALLAAIRECVTVVQPGEVLVVRVPFDLPDDEMYELTERARELRGETGTARIVFVAGEEFARLKAADAVVQVNGVLTEEVFAALKGEIHRRGGNGPHSVQRALGATWPAGGGD
jgi:hypothetical protein